MIRPCFVNSGQSIWQKTTSNKGSKFSGTPEINIIAPNLFLFTQSDDPHKRFCFHSATYGDIVPESLITDGASVPRLFWGADGFGPLDFARSAIIHDWIFECHHRYVIAEKSNSSSADTKKDKYKIWGSDDSYKKAADVMAECISQEMAFYSGASSLIDTRMKDLKSDPTSEYNGDIHKALSDMKNDFVIGSTNMGTLGMYHYAIGSGIAGGLWNTKHPTSSLTKIRSLKEDIDKAVLSGYMSSSVRDKLINLIKEDEKREQEQGKATLIATMKNAPGITKNTIRLAQNDEIMNVGAVYQKNFTINAESTMDALERKFKNIYRRSPHEVSRVPSTITEVRYYYTDDKREADSIRNFLESRGIKARSSYVVDPDIQARRSYQIAFSKTAFSPPPGPVNGAETIATSLTELSIH